MQPQKIVNRPLQRNLSVVHSTSGEKRPTDLHTEKHYERYGMYADSYYKDQMNRMFGPCSITAFFETVAAGFLLGLVPGPATTTNFLTSFGEVLQVLTANSKFFGNPRDVKPEIAKQAQDRSEGAMAWLQVFAGVGGLSGVVMDMVKKEEQDVDSLPFFKKLGLSVSSFISSVLMFFGYGEKSLLSATCQKNSKKFNSISLNGRSDARCSIEWACMTLFPWVTGVKQLKTLIDILIPVFALKDGIGHFIREGISMVFSNKQTKFENIFGKGFTTFLRSTLFRNGHQIPVPPLFGSEWYLGGKNSPGFRDKYVFPYLKLLRCNPPIHKLGENELIVTEFPAGVDKVQEEPKPNRTEYLQSATSAV